MKHACSLLLLLLLAGGVSREIDRDCSISCQNYYYLMHGILVRNMNIKFPNQIGDKLLTTTAPPPGGITLI